VSEERYEPKPNADHNYPALSAVLSSPPAASTQQLLTGSIRCCAPARVRLTRSGIDGADPPLYPREVTPEVRLCCTAAVHARASSTFSSAFLATVSVVAPSGEPTPAFITSSITPDRRMTMMSIPIDSPSESADIRSANVSSPGLGNDKGPRRNSVTLPADRAQLSALRRWPAPQCVSARRYSPPPAARNGPVAAQQPGRVVLVRARQRDPARTGHEAPEAHARP
jgi:hypothetical protein